MRTNRKAISILLDIVDVRFRWNNNSTSMIVIDTELFIFRVYALFKNRLNYVDIFTNISLQSYACQIEVWKFMCNANYRIGWFGSYYKTTDHCTVVLYILTIILLIKETESLQRFVSLAKRYTQ